MKTEHQLKALQDGKRDTQARVVWQISYLNVGFRCLRTAYAEESGAAHLLQIKADRGTWQNTKHLAKGHFALFETATSLIAAIAKT